jgi:hypothetical protein
LASIDELRQVDERPATAERSRMRFAIALAAALAVGLAALLLLAQLASQRESQGAQARDFLTKAMGASDASASLVRKPAPKVRLSVGRGARFERDGETVGVNLFGSSGTWTAHRRGATRPAPFGREAVVFRGEFGLEHYLRVDERQGTRTWRWRLDAPGLTPVLGENGAVNFLRGSRTAGIMITPVAIFDVARKNVTPKGSHWSLQRTGDSWTLALKLDDSELPLPYVIDPNISRTASNSAGTAGNATSIAITRPGNVGDILIAQIAVRNNDTVTAPGGWNLVSAVNSGTGLRQSVFWATNSGTLGTTFSWTNNNHGAGVISAYADVHPTSPIDASSSNSGTGTTATATGVTTNFANSMLVALYSAQPNVTVTQSGSQGVTQFATASSTGNPTGNRARVTASDGIQASAGGSGDKTATVSASNPWAAHLVALRREPPDGLGSIAPDRSNVSASSTGNTLVWTYTAPADGLAAGEVRLTVPANWSAPSSTGTDAGYTTASTGTVSFSGQTIIVSNVTLGAGATMTVTYGSTGSGGPGATASSTTGAVTWTTQQKGTSGGTLTNLASQPSITQNAPNGSGTMTASLSNVAASSTGNTITFTYTAATGGMVNGSVSIDVPANWSAPSTTGSADGYSNSTSGTLAVAGQTITVSGLTLTADSTVDIVYGSTTGGGNGATASSATGAVTWQAAQRSVNVGTLANLATSPSITQNAANGSGTMSPSISAVAAPSTGNTITFTYTAATGGMANGSVSIDVPAGWSAPSTNGSANGYSTSTSGTLGVAGQTITVSGLALAGGATFDIVYGSTAGGGSGATASSATGAVTWQAKQRSVGVGTLVDLAASPSITQYAANGSGTMSPSPSTVGYATAGNTLTFTYTAASGGMANGSVSIDVPGSWSAPSTTGTAAGYSTSTSGTVGVVGQTITVSGLTLAGGGTVDIVYGSTAGGGPGATAPASAGAQTWQAKQRSTSSGSLANLASSPSVTVAAQPAAPSGLATTPISPANDTAPEVAGTAPAGSTVKLYTTTDCSGGVAASGSAATFGGAGITVTVPDNATTNLSATATDTYGAVSPCSTSIAYTADSTPPGAPTISSSSPASPANDNDPELIGSAEGGSTVKIFTTSDCSGAPVASGSEATFAGGGISVNVGANSSTTFKATATDAVGNVSSCSAGLTYVEDSTAPSSSFSFPSAGGTYGSGGWSNPSGTASDTGGAGLDRVEISIRRDSTGLYWDGSGFNDGSENWRTAAGAASWSLSFAFSNFPADGGYTLRLRAVDTAGNVESPSSRGFTVDSTPPNTSITAQPSDPTNSTDPSFSFTSSEGGSTFDCRLDGGAWGACTSPKSYTSLGQGSHTFDVRATDSSGNTDASPASFTWTIDTTAPSSTLSFPAATSYRNSGWNDFSGTASDSGGAGLDRVELSIRSVSTGLYWDGAGFADGSENWRVASGTASWSLSFAATNFPADGDYVVRVRARDNATNVEGSPVSRTFTIDNAAPQTTVDTGPNDPTNSTDPSFAFSSSESGSTFECRLDGGAWSACTSPKSYAGLAQGAHTFDVRATDVAGNVDASTASFTWTIDTTAPSSVVTFPSSGGSYTTADWNDIDGTASDGGGAALDQVELSIRRVSTGLYWNGSAFADGSENWRTATGAASWSLAFAAANFPADGDYVVRVRARDTASNVEAPSSRSFTYDTAAPNTTITSQPNDPSNVTGPSFGFSSSEGGSSFECRLDAGAWSACTSPKSYSGLAQGSHTFEVRATDAAGNTDPTPASYTWTIDTTDPSSAISFPAASGFYNATAWSDFAGTASDSGGAALNTVELSIQRVADGLYWNGSAFADASENWRAATGTASWALSFAASNFPADGDYAIRVRASDTAGNVQAPISRSFSVDTVAPNTTVDSGPNDPTNGTAPSFTFSADQGGSTFECRLDGGTWSACTSPKSYSGVTQGSHTFEVRATDSAGNTDATPAPFTWTIDTTAPSSTLTFPTASDYNDAAWSNIGGTASDAGGAGLDKVEVSIRRSSTGLYWDGSGFNDGSENWRQAAGTASWTLAFAAANFPADGQYVIRVRARDNATNVEGSPSSTSFTIDNTPPNTSITSSPASITNNTAADFTFSSSESGSSFECRLDGGAWGACTSPESYTGLTQGSHTFDIRATDAAGNTDASPASFTWTVDTTAPSSTVSFPSAGATYSTAAWNDPAGTASESGGGALDTVELSIRRVSDGLYWNGTAFADASENWRLATGTASWTHTFAAAGFPADGDYMVRVRARDTAGNVEAPGSYTFTYDTTPPQTTIDSSPNDPTNATGASFAFSSSESGSTFECRLDGGAWSACTSPKSYAGLTQGSHTFDVRASDGAGNTDASPASFTWTIDTTDPASSVIFPTAAGSYSTATWNDPNGTASDAGGAALDHVEVSIRSSASGLYWDGSAFNDASENWRTATGAGAWSLSFAAANFPVDGDYVLRARAVDTAGNTEAPSTRTFTVDTVPPETTIDSAPANPISSSAADFQFSADQPGSTFQCRLDGGAWAACASPKSYAGLAEGSHTVDVRATDPGGNIDPSPATHTWVVDTVPPVVTMDDPGQYLRGTINLSSGATDTGGTGVASIAFQRSPAGAGTWSATPATWDTTGAANGLHDLRAVATDNAGNSSTSAPITGRWVDNLKPTVSVVDPGIGVTGTATIAANANDAHSGVEQVEIQYLDGGTWTTIGTDSSAPFEAAWDTTGLADGPYDLRAIATDFAGNVETSATDSTIVDNTDPTVAFTAPLDFGYVNAADADPFQLVADATDTGSGVKEVEFYECNTGGIDCTTSTSLGLDAGAPYQGSWTLPATDGLKHLKAIARDNAGRSAEVVIEVTLDRLEPDTTLASNPGDPSRDSTPDFTFSSNESPSTFECATDGGPWTPCPSPYTAAPLGDGPHTFDVRAVDAAGNVDPSPATWAWLVDTTPPTASIDDPGANVRGLVTLTSVESDPGANPSGIASVEYQYSVADANTWVATPALWDTIAVADGLYDVRVVVTDNAGNVTESAPVEDRRVDNSPPATAIDDPGANLRATVLLHATASDTGSGVQDVTFQISPDGASWSTIGIDNSDPYEVSFDTTTYPDGLYFFRTTATDVAGNAADGAAIGPRRIDNTLPTATLNDPGPNLRGTVNLSSTTDDPPGPPVASGVSSVVYEALIGSTWTGISQTWATTTFPDGVYDLHVVVTDVAGNTATSNVVGGRRVDNTPPTTGHNAPSGWQSGAVTVSLSPSDSGSGVSNTTFSVDGGGAQSGTSVGVSGDGIHTISFFSTDVAGNVESPQTATVMIDSTPPDPGAMDPGNYLRGTVTLTANPTGGGGGGAEVTEVEFQNSPAGAGSWSSLGVDQTSTENPPYTATWATGPGDDGSWDLRFIVRDEADNENITDLASKIVDNTAPTGSLSSPLAGSTVSGNVTLGVSANDANPIASVDYYVGGSGVGSSGSAPFQVSWSSTSVGDGPTSIYAVITDMAGNSHTTGSVGITVDNFPPTVSLGAPGADVSGSVGLSASASGDSVQVTFERRPTGGGGWTTIGTDTAAPWDATFDTTAVSDGSYELRAIAVDAGANSGASNIVSTRVDNTSPSGVLTRPGDGQRVGGSAVVLEANASDAGSGVASVTWEARQSGVGSFAAIAGDSGAPFAATWDVTGLPSVAHDLRIVVTDAAGNAFTGPTITVDVDSTPPTVSLTNPGSPLSGIVALSASTAGDATAVTFSRSPAGAATWTTITTDGSAPYSTNFDTTTVGDGVYDVRAVVTDAVGNTSESIVGGIRIDNFVPIIVSSVPANGSIVAGASQIVITATEDIAALTGVTFDGAPAAAPTVSGTTATFNTGVLSPGAHTLSGTVRDAAGNSSAFSITFMVGVPAPPVDGGGGDFADVLPLVPTPTNFRGTFESDGSLTLRWTPSHDAAGKPFATILYVDEFATQSLAPGEDQVNLGPFDPADMRRFSIAAVDTDGNASPTTAQLRSSSTLAGKTLDEATAVLVNRGFGLGAVRGTGTVVVEPQSAVMAALGSTIDVELGEPGTPQARLVFDAVGTKKYAPGSANKYIALRLKTTRSAQLTAALLSPSGARVYRWRFGVKAGTSIKRLTMPPQVRTPGRYRLVLTAQSGRESVKKTITLQIVRRATAKPGKTPIEVVLAGGSGMHNDIAAGLGGRVKVTSAVEEETWTFTASPSRNVQVIVVDVDRYGLELVRDLRTVFPTVKILALTNDPRRLAQAVRAGATIAVPRSTPPRDLAKLIARLARRPG